MDIRKIIIQMEDIGTDNKMFTDGDTVFTEVALGACVFLAEEMAWCCYIVDDGASTANFRWFTYGATAEEAVENFKTKYFSSYDIEE